MRHKLLLIILVLLTQCAILHRHDDYNGHYIGKLKATSCYPSAYVTAQIYDGTKFELTLGSVRRIITGTVSPEGVLSGQADWTDPPAKVSFIGEMQSKMFGGDFTGRVIDGRCNPTVDLIKPQVRH